MNYEMKPLILSLVLLMVSGSGIARDYTRYENLNNPTEYLFSVPIKRVQDALKVLVKSETIESLNFGFRHNGDLVFGPKAEYYTERYWTGPREHGTYGAPQEGWTGTITANFLAHITPEGENCHVKILASSFQQHVGHRYVVFPHFTKTGKYRDVKSDSYFEYLFLNKLGELVGEKGMPPLKGSAEHDEWSGMKNPAK